MSVVSFFLWLFAFSFLHSSFSAASSSFCSQSHTSKQGPQSSSFSPLFPSRLEDLFIREEKDLNIEFSHNKEVHSNSLTERFPFLSLKSMQSFLSQSALFLRTHLHSLCSPSSSPSRCILRWHLIFCLRAGLYLAFSVLYHFFLLVCMLGDSLSSSAHRVGQFSAHVPAQRPQSGCRKESTRSVRQSNTQRRMLVFAFFRSLLLFHILPFSLVLCLCVFVPGCITFFFGFDAVLCTPCSFVLLLICTDLGPLFSMSALLPLRVEGRSLASLLARSSVDTPALLSLRA